jgi:hypothetical protein
MKRNPRPETMVRREGAGFFLPQGTSLSMIVSRKRMISVDVGGFVEL